MTRSDRIAAGESRMAFYCTTVPPFSYHMNQITGISEAFLFSLATENFDDKDQRNTAHCPRVCREIVLL